MSDVSVPYTLTTPGGTIVFNDDSADQFYLTETPGLGTPPIRAPIDPVPFGDGGILHTFWKGPRHVTLEGVFLITSSRVQNTILTIRNQMEESLITALESIIAANGTLAWTPLGLSGRSLTVRHDIPFEASHIEGYKLRAFTFGLVAADPDW